MNHHVKTRSQRRMEKRQALTVLALVLVVSLASFTLGVMVGQRGSSSPSGVVTEQVAPPPVAATPPQTPAAEPVEPLEPVELVEPVMEDPPIVEEDMSFYKRLPEGEAPLGSGINQPTATEPAPVQLPAETSTPVVAETPAKAAPVVATPPPTPEKVAPVAKPKPSVAKTTAKADGGYAIQVGAFQSKADAESFKKKLNGQGYPAFVVTADLGAKGTWYRVRVGPFDKSGADAAVKRLKEAQKISGFVTRM